ncbi:MAG: hypothetical protein ACI8RE_001640 [Ilumatobacter sp.]|jgi:hypothetical protein
MYDLRRIGPMSIRRRSSTRLWELIDPCASETGIRSALSQILDLFNSNWTLDRPIDIGSPHVRALLERHRIATLVPLDRGAAADRAWLRTKHINIAASHLRIRSSAGRILASLDDAGIETRVLKGLATAELDYPNQQLRHTADVDLAIRPDDLDEALPIPTANGHRATPRRSTRCSSTDRRSTHPTESRSTYTLDSLAGAPPTRSCLPTAASNSGRSRASLCVQNTAWSTLQGTSSSHRQVGYAGCREWPTSLLRTVTRSDLDLDEARRFAAALGVEPLVGAGIRVEAELSERTAVLRALDTWQQPDWLERNTRLVAHRRLVLDHFGRYREVPRGQRLRYLPTCILPTAQQRHLLHQPLVATSSRLVRRKRTPDLGS